VRRRTVPLVLAFVLGVSAAFAASCTSGGVKGGLPQTSANDLKAQIDDVQEFVDRGDCDGIDGQLRQVQQAIDNLPASTDEALVTNLRQGAERLQSSAISACNSRTEAQTQTQSETQPQETVTETIPTETTPTEPPATEPVPPQTVPGDTSGGAGTQP
jgi:hypothetical protein